MFTDDLEYCDCIPSKILNQLSNDVAKLKAKGVVDQISQNKLTLLINFAMRNIDVAKNCSAGPVRKLIKFNKKKKIIRFSLMFSFLCVQI